MKFLSNRDHDSRQRLSLVTTLLIATLSVSLPEKVAYSSACCARNSATPTLIIGDDKAQMTFGYSWASVVAEADEDGAVAFGSPDMADVSEVYRFEGAFLLTDRLQMGGSFTLVNHMISQPDVAGSAFGIGDARISLGYELLAPWNYSKWKPQVFGFMVLTMPLGRSKYDNKNPLLTDVTGNGFYSLSLGGLFLKRWSTWDAFLLPEVHYSFPRTFPPQTFPNDQSGTQVIPGFGGSFGFGAGLSPWGGDLRVGVRIQPRLDQTTTTVLADRTSRPEGVLSVCDSGFDVSYLLSTTDSLMASYTDQTLLGDAKNLNLNRTIAILFQHRWER